MKVRICPECETQNKDIAYNCSNCGATLSLNTIVDIAEIQGEDDRVTAVSPSPENDLIALFSGALAGFFVPIIISIFFAIYSIIDNFLYYFNRSNHVWTNYRFYLDDIIYPIGIGITFGIIYSVGLALMGLILTDKKNIGTPQDWAKAAGKTTFVILLVLTILASPWLLFGIAHMLVEGQEESVWGLFYLYIFLIGLSVVSGYVGGHIFKRLCQRRNL